MSHQDPLLPPYPIVAKDEPVLLYEGRLEILTQGNASVEGSGTVKFVWRPAPRAVFELLSQNPTDALPDEAQLRLDGRDLTADVWVGTKNIFENSRVAGTINRTQSHSQDVSIAEVRFVAANLRWIIGESLVERTEDETESSRSYWAGRVVLADDAWKVVLDARQDHRAVQDRLSAEGGVEITHVGALSRTDGSTFSAVDASDVLHALGGFLALVRGDWAPVLLPVGFAADGTRVWEDWSQRHSSSWRGASSPLDPHHREHVAAAFKGFMRRWRDPLWHRPLRVATHMYVEANGPVTSDTSLVLAQAALELIAWVMFVEDMKTRTKNDFDGAKASDRLRELLDWMNVPRAIPESLEELHAAASRLDLEDGPHAITALRNALIHPPRRDILEEPSMGARIELHQLSLFYLELALLRLIGFDGEYANRLGSRWVGDVEPVPWKGTIQS